MRLASCVGFWLWNAAPTEEGQKGSVVFTFSLVFLFSVSGIYHVINWRPEARKWWRRLDHAAIFVVIAGRSHANVHWLCPCLLCIVAGLKTSEAWQASALSEANPKWFLYFFAIKISSCAGLVCVSFVCTCDAMFLCHRL